MGKNIYKHFTFLNVFAITHFRGHISMMRVLGVLETETKEQFRRGT